MYSYCEPGEWLAEEWAGLWEWDDRGTAWRTADAGGWTEGQRSGTGWDGS